MDGGAGARARARRGGLAWIEEPIRSRRLPGHRHARRASSPRQFRLEKTSTGRSAMADALAAKACDYAMPDFARIGGVSGWMDAAVMAQAAGMQMSSHLYPEFSATCSP